MLLTLVVTEMHHFKTCHRCGNVREKLIICSKCPNVFCTPCAERLSLEDGKCVDSRGCSVCKGLCCCTLRKTHHICPRSLHCYKKCTSQAESDVVKMLTTRKVPVRVDPLQPAHGLLLLSNWKPASRGMANLSNNGEEAQSPFALLASAIAFEPGADLMTATWSCSTPDSTMMSTDAEPMVTSDSDRMVSGSVTNDSGLSMDLT